MQHLELKGYKSIRSIKLKLNSVNILIGANGSGKTNLLSFFEFLRHLYHQKLQEYVGLRGGIEKFLHHSNLPSNEIYACLTSKNNRNDYAFSISKADDSFVISKEILDYEGNLLTEQHYSKEAGIKKHDWFRAAYIRQNIFNYYKYHFHDTGQKSPFNQASHIENDSLILYSKGENLAPILLKIRKENPKTYFRICNNIRSIAPYFSNFILEPNENGYVRLFWQDNYSEYIYGVNDLSDGTLRFVALAVLFMQPDLPSTIIIDEPELGLHPLALAKLSSMIQAAAGRGSQIILATQSADLINYFEPEDIIAVNLENGGTIFKRLERSDLKLWLEEYTLGTLWQKNIITQAQPF